MTSLCICILLGVTFFWCMHAIVWGRRIVSYTEKVSCFFFAGTPIGMPEGRVLSSAYDNIGV